MPHLHYNAGSLMGQKLSSCCVGEEDLHVQFLDSQLSQPYTTENLFKNKNVSS